MMTIIAAIDHIMAIGFENKLIFWLPNDFEALQSAYNGTHHRNGTQNI